MQKSAILLRRGLVLTAYDRCHALGLPELLAELGNTSTGSIQGVDKIHLLQSLITVRTAENGK